MKLAAAWLVAGCGASINAFDATPHHACVGDTVTITWNVTGSASLALTPPSTEVPDGDVASTGTKLFHPQASTTIVLHASRTFGDKEARQDVVVAPPQAELVTATVDDSATCAAGVLSAAVDVHGHAADVTLTTVAVNGSDPHTVQIDHDGHLATVAPGTPSAALSGVPIDGHWILSAHLVGAEACNSPTLPANLVVSAAVTCR